MVTRRSKALGNGAAKALGWSVTLALAAACGQSPLPPGGTLVSGPATLERRVTVAFGGYAWWIEVDSAAATLRVSCEQVQGSRVGMPCSTIPTRVIQLAPADVRQLFVATRQQEFRALRAEYDMSATFVDGPAYSLKVVRGEAIRQIRWSDAARPLPAVLQSVSDRMLDLAGIPE